MAKELFPPGVGANRLAQQVGEIIKQYCFFPGPILMTQCKRIGKTLAELAPGDLEALAPYIARSVENFTNPQNGEEVRKAILALKT